MRNLWIVGSSMFLAGLFCAQIAAQESGGVDLEHFRPSTNGTGVFGVESPYLLEPWKPYLGVSFNFASAPLAVKYIDGTVENVAEYQTVAHVQAGIGILPMLDFGVDFPVAIMQQGTWLITEQAISGQAIGDLRLVPRVRFMDSVGSDAPVSLTLSLPVTLPTGEETAYMGEEGVTFNPQLVVGDGGEKLAWHVALGYRLRPDVSLLYPPINAQLELGDELTYGAAVRLKGSGPLHAGLEVEGATGFKDGMADDPLEARVGVGLQAADGLFATLGVGFGLTSGYGTPLWRGFAIVGHRFGGVGPRVKDLDDDGVEDSLDLCPEDPEDPDGFEDEDGCVDPDNDGDGMFDRDDKCPDEAEDIDGFEDEDGCPDPDNDRDTILDRDDKCPGAPEDVDGFEDEDGCPDLDHDKDGIVDMEDKCPEDAETINGYQDNDGCPEPDRDGDNIPDEIDKCPDKPEWINNFDDGDGCPERDSDNDGIPDEIDKCKKQPETKNNYKDEDGCPERDMDGDGIPDEIDKCKKLPEPMNGIWDEDGCPDEDTDKDGIPDMLDYCRKKPETVNGYKDEDGCPDTPPAAK